MANQIATGIGCPACKRPQEGEGLTMMLYTHHGSSSYKCSNGHEYTDMGELLDLNPEKLPVPMRKTVQEGHETISLQIPPDLRKDLLTKFGTPEKLSQTLAGVLRTLAENRCILFNEVDIDRVEKISGVKIRTGADLVGLVFERNKAAVDAAAQLANRSPQAEQTGTTVPEGKILIDSSSFIGKAASVARFRSEPIEVVLERTLKMAFDNGWA